MLSSSDATITLTNKTIDCDGTGNVISNINANELDPVSGTWSGPKEIDVALSPPATYPYIALNDAGQAACVYAQFHTDTGYHTYVSLLRSESPVGTVLVDYYSAASVASLPANAAAVTHRKLEPLRGEKTHIHYGLPAAGAVSVRIYNLQGELARTLVNGYQDPGTYDLDWAGENDSGARVASGVYVIQVKTPTLTDLQKVVVIK